MDTSDSHIEPEIAEYPEAGPFWVGLWAVARHWAALLEQIFEPDLMATGVTRSFASRCQKWLWSIEGLLRRLIIAAAMKLDLSQLPRLIAGARKASLQRPSSVSFKVLPHLPGRQPCATRPAASVSAPEHRHLVFPGDSLLQLFPRHDRRNAPRVYSRRANPLQRRGRISRWDPDYRGCQPSHHESRPRSGPRTRADRSSPSWKPPAGGLPEWKRIEGEWERVIAAPQIAGRIKAILRVLEHPERIIARTARRLHADASLIGRLRDTLPPRFRKPKLDRGADPPLVGELIEAHTLAFADTS